MIFMELIHIFYFIFRAYNVPDRYVREIEKKCQNTAKSRFTFSYFGLKWIIVYCWAVCMKLERVDNNFSFLCMTDMTLICCQYLICLKIYSNKNDLFIIILYQNIERSILSKILIEYKIHLTSITPRGQGQSLPQPTKYL